MPGEISSWRCYEMKRVPLGVIFPSRPSALTYPRPSNQEPQYHLARYYPSFYLRIGEGDEPSIVLSIQQLYYGIWVAILRDPRFLKGSVMRVPVSYKPALYLFIRCQNIVCITLKKTGQLHRKYELEKSRIIFLYN